MNERRKRVFVRTLLVGVHLLTVWVTVTSLNWIYSIKITGEGSVDPVVAGIAFGVPSVLITAMFKVCQLYLREYSKSGVDLENGIASKIELELQGTLVEKDQ